MAGECHELLGHAEAAADSYRRALRIEPNDWRTLCRLGYCERLRGHAAESVTALMRAAMLRPDSAITLNELALALLQAGRRREALARLRRAIEVDPACAPARRNLARTLYVLHVEGWDGEPVTAAQVLDALDAAPAADSGDPELLHLAHAMRGEQVPQPPSGYVEGFFDRFAPRFDEKVLQLGYRAPAVAAEILAPRLADRRGRIVDLGCGTGLAAGLLRPAAAYLAGVDLSGGMLARARERGGYDELFREDIAAWLERQPRASLDCALALDVFIYVGDLSRVIPACAAALAPGGLLAFTVERLEEGARFALRPSGRYAHAPGDVQALCERTGLGLAESREFAIRQEAGREIPAVFFVFVQPSSCAAVPSSRSWGR